MPPNPDDLLGQTVGPYVLDSLIGQGGFAWVYAGHPSSGGDPVALKVLKPRFGGDAEFDARFRAESEAAAKMDHPNVVNIREVGRAGGHTYQVMDLYPDSLGSLIKREGPLSEDRAISIAQDILGGLQYAHDGGVLHRDIKVDNVLLRADGSAVIADFGLSRAISGYTSATGVDMTIGTPQYISPEQAQGRAMDGRSDLYSVGVTLYRAVTGDAPFHSNDWFELARMHVEERPPSLRSLRPELSDRFDRIVLKCLAKHPDDRYRSASALQDELAEIRNASRSTETFGTPAVRTDEMVTFISTARPRWQVIVVAVLVVVAVAYLVVLLGG
jgi:serine/threonine-protein kinase